MRQEILFKAQRADGKGWVEGCPVNNMWINSHTSEPALEIITGHYESDCWEDAVTEDTLIVSVIPETLCQFVKEIDGKNAFSDDTFKIWLEDSQEEEGGYWWNCYIGMHKGCWCLLQIDFDYSNSPLNEAQLLFETDYKLIPTGNLHD